MSRATLGWIVLGWVGFVLLPWYGFDRAVVPTIADYFAGRSALIQGLNGAWWLLPILAPLCLALIPVIRPSARTNGTWLVASGLLGLALIILQGFSIGLNGWAIDILEGLLGAPGPSQAGMGYGAALTATAFLITLCHGLAARGWCRGDAFVTSSIGVVIALIIVFVFFPVTTILASAFADNDGNFAPYEFLVKFLDRSIWGLDCLSSDLRCGTPNRSCAPFAAVAIFIEVGSRRPPIRASSRERPR